MGMLNNMVFLADLCSFKLIIYRIHTLYKYIAFVRFILLSRMDIISDSASRSRFATFTAHLIEAPCIWMNECMKEWMFSFIFSVSSQYDTDNNQINWAQQGHKLNATVWVSTFVASRIKMTNILSQRTRKSANSHIPLEWNFANSFTFMLCMPL